MLTATTMRIQIYKGDGRHSLRCFRDDGTSTHADSGPGLPHHDLAHYVAERTIGLGGGFFGQIAAGRSIQELSDAAVIPTLGAEPMIAEALAGALGSLATGACEPEEFAPMVQAQLGESYARVGPITEAQVLAMWERFEGCLDAWSQLPPGESLLLEWP